MLNRLIAICFLFFCANVHAANTDIAYTKNEANPRVEVQTNYGKLVLEVFVDRAPQSANYFLSQVASNHYNGTIFHRVSKDFVIQGGAYTANLSKKSMPSNFGLEKTALKNRRGTLAIARKLSDINSGNAEFFINVVDNPQLDYQSEKSPSNQGFAVFAQIVEGFDVIDKMRKAATTQKTGFGAVPNTPIVIQSMKRLEQ